MNEQATKTEIRLMIKSVAFGVRYEPQYRVRDRMGALIDAILRAAGTPFGPSVFPLSNAGAHAHELLNPDNNNSLRVTQSDTLLELESPTKDLERIANLARDFQTFVLGPLRDVCGVHRIIRHGMLVRFDESALHVLQSPTVRYADPDLPTPRDLTLRFSYRLATPDGYFRKHVDDYRNIIYTIQQNDENQASLSLDYQEYFSPPLEASDWAKRNFTVFAEDSLLYHRKTFADWVQKVTVAKAA